MSILPDIAHLPDGDPKIARTVHTWLVEHPEHHDQNHWAVRDGEEDSEDNGVSGRTLHCGTTCCIGGLIAVSDGWDWADVVAGYKDLVDIPDHVGKRLGLDHEEANELLYNFNNSAALLLLGELGA